MHRLDNYIEFLGYGEGYGEGRPDGDGHGSGSGYSDGNGQGCSLYDRHPLAIDKYEDRLKLL